MLEGAALQLRAPRTRMAWNACSFSDEWLKDRLSKGYTMTKIAKEAGTCTKSIQRRMRRRGLHLHTPIDDDEVAQLVLDWTQRHGFSGVAMLHSTLLSRGIRLQKYKLREMLQAANPEASKKRSTPSLPLACARSKFTMLVVPHAGGASVQRGGSIWSSDR